MNKFHFQCEMCGEQFNVQLRYLLNKDSIVCPNCSASLSDDSFKYLKSAANSLYEYQKRSKNDPDCFVLTIQ